MNQANDFHIRLQQIETLSPKLNQGVQIILVVNSNLTVETNSRYYHMERKIFSSSTITNYIKRRELAITAP